MKKYEYNKHVGILPVAIKNEVKCQKFEKGDIIVAELPPVCGQVSIVPEDGDYWVGVITHKVLRDNFKLKKEE